MNSSSINAKSKKNDAKLSSISSKKISNLAKIEAVLPPRKENEPSKTSKINADSNTHRTPADGISNNKSRSKEKQSNAKSGVDVRNSKTSEIKDLFELSSENGSSSRTKNKFGSNSSVKVTKSKLKMMAKWLNNCNHVERKNYIDEWSKDHPKLMNKLIKMMEIENKSKRNANTGTDTPVEVTVDITDTDNDTILTDELTSEPAEKTVEIANANCASSKNSDNSCVDMDIDDDDDDTSTSIVTVIADKSSSTANTLREKSPSVAKDTINQRDETGDERNDEEDRIRREILKLEQEEKSLEASIEKHGAEIKERSSLSKQLEAVMNATSSQKPETLAPLFPAFVNVPLPAATSTVESVPPFSNPFGLAQPTKDIDYRHLFAFPVPSSVVVPSSTGNELAHTVESKNVETVVVTSSPSEKIANKRREPDDDEQLNSNVKRRHIMNDNDGNDRQSAESFSPPPESKCSKKYRYDDSPYSNEYDNDVDADHSTDGPIAKRKRNDDASASSEAVTEETKGYNGTVITSAASEPRASSQSPPPMFPFFGRSFGSNLTNRNFSVISSTKPEVPDANCDVLRMIERDPVKEMDLYGKRCEIRHYGSTAAVVFLNWDDPRQISYYSGKRTIKIDNKIEIRCVLNEPDVETMVYGRPHRFRFGPPTRELYIDGIGYECPFNGPPIRVRIDDVFCSIKLIGRPPGIDVGKHKRTDLVAGKINIIIDEAFTFPIFLDAKPQSIFVDDVPFIIMFIDALKRIVINDVPFKAEFGGLSQSFKFRNKVYCFRLTGLPIGIVPGAVNIFQMVMTKLPSPPPFPPSLQYPALGTNDDFSLLSPSPLGSNMPSVLNVPGLPPPPPLPPPPMSNVCSMLDNRPVTDEAKPQSNISENVNIDELLQRLIASGIVPSSNNNTTTDTTSDASLNENVNFVDFEKPETLKQKQPAMVAKLYSGVQCNSCDLRFPSDKTVEYSVHLDWHCTVNNKNIDGIDTIQSRKWFRNISDWISQEIDDPNNSETNYFDNYPVTDSEQKNKEVPCVIVAENEQNAVCDFCKDKFENFSDENERCVARNAIRVEDKIYHVFCYQDNQEKNDSLDVEEVVNIVESIDVDDISTSEEITIADETCASEKCDDTVQTNEHTSRRPSLVDENVVESNEPIVIKQEKLDSTETTASAVSHKNSEKLDNSEEDTLEGNRTAATIEEEDEDLQLIELPIEEIIINDEENDLEESNLETLNLKDMIEAENMEVVADSDQSKPESVPENNDDDLMLIGQHSQIVDITHHVPNTVSIDGNIDMGESLPPMNTGTKIKINIMKNLTEVKSPSSIVTPAQPELKETDKVVAPIATTVEENPQLPEASLDEQLLPPGEELTAEKKTRLKDGKLTEYPPVSKGIETSALCTIM